jgi:5-oxoprolinase (ATP-hydrolysing)
MAEGRGQIAEEVAEGFLTIAVENMANAIKKISVQRGYDVTRYLLNCFGGAGGQHACLVADALGMESMLIHPALRPALGLRDRTRERLRQPPAGLVKPLEADSRTEVRGRARSTELASRRVRGTQEPGRPDLDAIVWRPMLHLRYDGTDTTLPSLSSDDFAAARAEFETAHKAQFGFVYPNKPVIIEAISVEEHRRPGDHGASPNAKPLDPRRRSTGKPPGLSARHMARGARIFRARGVAPATASGPGAHHRAQPDRRCRAGLGRQLNARDDILLTRHEKLDRALRHRRRRRPTRSCSRCSTTCSCRSPSRWA